MSTIDLCFGLLPIALMAVVIFFAWRVRHHHASEIAEDVDVEPPVLSDEEAEALARQQETRRWQHRLWARFVAAAVTVSNWRLVQLLVDVFTSPKLLWPVGAALGLFIGHKGLWDYIDPPLQVAGLALLLSTWRQTRKAEKAYYKSTANADERHVVALEVGRPISEAVKDRFGHLDVLVRVQDVIGRSVLLSQEDYEAVARAVYKACAACQNKPIDLIVSGPNGLLFIVGQMMGLDRFRVAVWQYYNGEYQEVPRPTRDWLEHRD